jgi:hypothetical protein
MLKRVIFLMMLSSSLACAQGREGNIIRVTGLVVEGDSSYGVPGAHIWIPTARLGTISNPMGFFQINAVPGDTVVFSYVGFEKHKLAIPLDFKDPALTIIVDLKAESTLLPAVTIYPYSSVELFKEAFLALDLPLSEREKLEKTLGSSTVSTMSNNLGMDYGSNHRQFMNQQIGAQSSQNNHPTFSIADPFAWRRFIKSVKKGELKRKER